MDLKKIKIYSNSLYLFEHFDKDYKYEKRRV